MRDERQVHLAVVPCVAQFVGRDGNRRKTRRGLALQKTEAFAEFGGDQVAQTHVVDEHQQANVGRRGRRSHAGGYIADDNGDLGLEIDTPGFVREHDVILWTEQLSEPP